MAASVEERQDLLAGLRNWSLERDDSGPYRIYRDEEGKEYYSVTTILSNTVPEAKKRSLEKWKARPGSDIDLEIACNRGTISHEHCEYVLKVASKINRNICNSRNCWKVYKDGLARGPKAILTKSIQTARERSSQVSWTARGYAKNLANWLEENVAAIHASEFSVYHPDGFAGQADALIDYGPKPGNICIVDFKTSGSKKPKPDEWLQDYLDQLSAYAYALEENASIRPTMGVVVIARENGVQVREVSQLELLGGKCRFKERLDQFKEMLVDGTVQE